MTSWQESKTKSESESRDMTSGKVNLGSWKAGGSWKEGGGSDLEHF